MTSRFFPVDTNSSGTVADDKKRADVSGSDQESVSSIPEREECRETVGWLPFCVSVYGTLEHHLTVTLVSGSECALVPLAILHKEFLPFSSSPSHTTNVCMNSTTWRADITSSPFFSVEAPPQPRSCGSLCDPSQLASFERVEDGERLMNALGIRASTEELSRSSEKCGVASLSEEQRLTALLMHPVHWAGKVVGKVVLPPKMEEEEQQQGDEQQKARSTSWSGAVLGAMKEQLEFAGFLGIRAALLPMAIIRTLSATHRRDLIALLQSICVQYDTSGSTQLWVECNSSDENDWKEFVDLRNALKQQNSVPDGQNSECPLRCGETLAFDCVYAVLTVDSSVDDTPVSCVTAWLGEPVVAVLVPPSFTSLWAHKDHINDAAIEQDTEGKDVCMSFPVWAPFVNANRVSSRSFLTLLLSNQRTLALFCDAEINDSPSALMEMVSHTQETLLYERAKTLVEAQHRNRKTSPKETIGTRTHTRTPLDAAVRAMQVEDHRLATLRAFANTLQLPLQPLHDNLSSAVYATFERDAEKYNAYFRAFDAYCSDWANSGILRPHLSLRTASGFPGTIPYRTMCAVLLGGGRGPLVSKLLLAASKHGISLHLFVVEKNASAVMILQHRLAHDSVWQELLANSANSSHTVDIMCADGRKLDPHALAESIHGESDSDGHSPYFGWCDVVVSELLGSFGDNELSPECIDGFLARLEAVQRARGIPVNENLVCIPQSYTPYAAPLYSAVMQREVGGICRRGIRGSCSEPSGSNGESVVQNSHTAAHHTVLISHMVNGISLAAPQPCWTFTHAFNTSSSTRNNNEKDECSLPRAAPTSMRLAQLEFTAACSGILTGLVGYFEAVLYFPLSNSGKDDSAPVMLSILPSTRTPSMFSWFPCMFPLPPDCATKEGSQSNNPPRNDYRISRGDRIAVELSRNSNSTTHTCHNSSQSDVERVWYTWRCTVLPSSSTSFPNESSGDNDLSLPAEESHLSSGKECAHNHHHCTSEGIIANQSGWASSFLLC